MLKIKDFVVNGEVDVNNAHQAALSALVEFDKKFGALLAKKPKKGPYLSIVEESFKDIDAIWSFKTSFVDDVNRIKKFAEDWDKFADALGEMFDESYTPMASLPGFLVDFMLIVVVSYYFRFNSYNDMWTEACYFAYECDFGKDGRVCSYNGKDYTLDSAEAWEQWLKATTSGKEE